MPLPKSFMYFLAAVLGFLFSFVAWPLFGYWLEYHWRKLFVKEKTGA